ncbi:Hypothetical protein D9617_3g022730 [Elsinoe fawcettii]|nr:Hypothetical protein D9617_3g022730 [Elsinoe fawcettii]
MLPDRASHILVSGTILYAASLLTTSLRLFVRWKRLRTDDHLMILCMIFFTVYFVIQMISVPYGNGMHLENTTTDRAETAMLCWFLAGLTYEPATITLKLSVGASLLRYTTTKWHVRVVHLLGASIVVFGIAYWFFLLFQCSPISYWWDLQHVAKGSCISSYAYIVMGYVAGVLNSLADLAYVILPFFMVWDSSWRLKVKITVILLLGMGSFAGIATTIRMVYGFAAKDVYDKTNSDFLYSATPIAILSTAEMGVGITAASTATLRPLFDRSFGRRKKALQSQPQLARRKSSARVTGPSRSWSIWFLRSVRSERRPTLPIAAQDMDETAETRGTLVTISKKDGTWNDMPDLTFVSEFAVRQNGGPQTGIGERHID